MVSLSAGRVPATGLKLLAVCGLAIASSAARATEIIEENVTIRGQTPMITFTYQPGHTDHFYSINATELRLSFANMLIAPASPSLLYLDSLGNAAIGPEISPLARLHVAMPSIAGAEAIARFAPSDTPSAFLDFDNASATDGVFIPRIRAKSDSQNTSLTMDVYITDDTGANPAIVFNASKDGGGGLVNRPLIAFRNQNVAKVTITANGAVKATSFTPVSSRSLKSQIRDIDSRTAGDAVAGLTPVEFRYKDDPTAEGRVGFIAEDVPEIAANPGRDSVPIMDTVALVTRVVKDQQQAIEGLQQTLDDQERAADRQRQMLLDLDQSIEQHRHGVELEIKSARQRRQTIESLMKRLDELEGRGGNVR